MTGYAFYADQEYEREDGTKGNGFTITKAFDISQTRASSPALPAAAAGGDHRRPGGAEPCSTGHFRSAAPRGAGAVCPQAAYHYVRNGMDETATICAIAREQAHAGFDTVGSGYYRQAYAPQPIVRPMWWRRNLGWTPPLSTLIRCARPAPGWKSRRKRDSSATSSGRPMPSTGYAAEFSRDEAGHPAG